MIIQMQVFGRHFLGNKWNKPATSSKTTDFQAFKQKLEFWKVYVHDLELDSSLLLKDFSDEINGEIDKCDF